MSRRLRVALVQLDSVPAYATRVSYYRDDPAPPASDGNGSPGFLGGLSSKKGIAALGRLFASAHGEDLHGKLRAILSRCAEYRPHLILFPEYSISPADLNILSESARSTGAVVVGGSHVVRNNRQSLELYRQSPLKDLCSAPIAHVRKALAPVFFPDGSVQLRFKANRSQWETDLLVDDTPAAVAPLEIDVEGARVKVDLRICVDAIAGPAPSAGADLLAVIAASPTTKPFSDVNTASAWREIPGVVVNSAVYGGTTVRALTPTVPSSFADLLSLPARSEALLVADLDLDAQARRRGSVVDLRPVDLVARLPLLFECVPDHAEVLDWLQAVRESKWEIREQDVQLHLRRKGLPAAFKEQLEVVLRMMSNGSFDARDGRLLVDALAIGRQILPFPNRCVQALDQAQKSVAELLVNGDSDPALAQALTRIVSAIQTWKPHQSVLSMTPTPLSDAAVDENSPFQNREQDRRRLAEALRTEHLVIIEGLPGIGKNRLVSEVIRECAPRARVLHKHCARGVTSTQLVDELLEELDLDTAEGLRTMSSASKARFNRLVVLHNAESLLEEDEEDGAFHQFIDSLQDSGIRILALSSKQIQGFPGSHLQVRKLRDEELGRILRFWCEVYDVVEPTGLVAKLHGYPLAARYAATALRDGRDKTFDHVGFVKRIRAEIVRVLLSDIALAADEEKALRALCVFRRPVHESVLPMLPIDGIEELVQRLENALLVERKDETVFVVPLVRDFAEEEWLKGAGYGQFHAVAARFYQIAQSSSRWRRLEAREEAVYHLYSSGQFNEARALGASWEPEARAAMQDLARRREYVDCLAVCEQLTLVRGYSVDVGGQMAYCFAKLHRLADARAEVAKMRRLGRVPNRTLASVGEALVAGGAFTEGMPMLEEAASNDPSDAYVRAAIAAALLDRNEPERARDYVEEALEIDPECFRALEVGSRIARSAGLSEKAFFLAKRAMRIHPVRGQKAFDKAMSELRRKYAGQVPPELMEHDESEDDD